MAAWPSTLPPPTTDYKLAPVDPVVRTEMESGASRSRRRTRARNDHVSAVWKLKDAQMQIFRAWFDSDSGAAGGAAWFTIDLPTGDGGIQNVTAKFKKVFESSYLHRLKWQVSAELEIR